MNNSTRNCHTDQNLQDPSILSKLYKLSADTGAAPKERIMNASPKFRNRTVARSLEKRGKVRTTSRNNRISSIQDGIDLLPQSAVTRSGMRCSLRPHERNSWPTNIDNFPLASTM
ncbi:hypothetical protein FOMG_19637 [Fusarium oxysporum f. sp. melonis 26406]|uniref:Uncharacterized protein n=1 Tax=Fusarium oxysporum f. sp. melonis 26406 TaxID=1089452 RepID=W9Z4R5_FUSOX|nr:hypothetical protein FOMG_19637 [Fusarium oxysporum f. sp. melonis 26406]